MFNFRPIHPGTIGTMDIPTKHQTSYERFLLELVEKKKARARDLTVEALREIADYAAKYTMVLALENVLLPTEIATQTLRRISALGASLLSRILRGFPVSLCSNKPHGDWFEGRSGTSVSTSPIDSVLSHRIHGRGRGPPLPARRFTTASPAVPSRLIAGPWFTRFVPARDSPGPCSCLYVLSLLNDSSRNNSVSLITGRKRHYLSCSQL